MYLKLLLIKKTNYNIPGEEEKDCLKEIFFTRKALLDKLEEFGEILIALRNFDCLAGERYYFNTEVIKDRTKIKKSILSGEDLNDWIRQYKQELLEKQKNKTNE